MDESTLSIYVSNSINFAADKCLNLGTYVHPSADCVVATWPFLAGQ